MRIDVVGRHIEITDPIRQYAEDKASKLSRYFDAIQLITCTVEATKQDSHQAFKVEFVVDVEKHDDFVSSEVDTDVYRAIDSAIQKSSRQLSDFKERLKNDHHR